MLNVNCGIKPHQRSPRPIRSHHLLFSTLPVSNSNIFGIAIRGVFLQSNQIPRFKIQQLAARGEMIEELFIYECDDYQSNDLKEYFVPSIEGLVCTVTS